MAYLGMVSVLKMYFEVLWSIIRKQGGQQQVIIYRDVCK